jgi:hypothetical protein
MLVIVLIGATYLFIEPGFTKENMTIAEIPVYHTEDDEPVVFDIMFEPFDRCPDSVTELMKNIKKEDVASKESYIYSPDGVDNVHVCINMAVDQAMWINETYDYTTGVVMLRYKYLGDDHAQTWVTIDGTIYIIESISNKWWTVVDHENAWSDDHKIEFVSLKKGLEFEKENNEWVNNKDY